MGILEEAYLKRGVKLKESLGWRRPVREVLPLIGALPNWRLARVRRLWPQYEALLAGETLVSLAARSSGVAWVTDWYQLL